LRDFSKKEIDPLWYGEQHITPLHVCKDHFQDIEPSLDITLFMDFTGMMIAKINHHFGRGPSDWGPTCLAGLAQATADVELAYMRFNKK
jgi:hypothetical protein